MASTAMFQVSMEAALGIAVAVAGLCGWLTKISIDLGRLLSKTDARIEVLEKASTAHAETLIDHDRRLVTLEAQKA